MEKLDVRTRIIETASRLFYLNGYNQTGINQIVAEANVAKASMYQHFRSKQDIAVAYLVRRHIMWMVKLDTYVLKEQNPKLKIIAAFDYLLDWLNDVNFRGCGWQNIITDLPQGHDKINEQAIFHKNELRTWIHDILKKDEKYSSKEAENVGDEILILIEGAIILSQILKDELPILTAKRASIKLLN